ncbi:glycoside hydrolase family 99-like domain-containing protein, partial [Candidatus Poribacteria bacterium]
SKASVYAHSDDMTIDHGPTTQDGLKILKSWKLGESEDWTYNVDARTEDGVLELTSTGSDPIMSGPQYETLPASNRQAVEIRLRSDSSGTWQLFYSNTNEGQYGGYSEEWSTRFHVPASTDWQIVRVCPFWKALGNTVRIRIDPANGYYQIDWIRIVEIESPSPSVSWRSKLWWPYSDIKSLLASGDTLVANADVGEGVLLASTDFDSALANVLYVRSATTNLDGFAFCWANDVNPGLHRAYIVASPDGLMHTTNLDLSGSGEWNGQIDVVGFAFGHKEGDVLELGDFMISDSPQGQSEMELFLLLGEPAIRRQGQTMSLLAYLRNAGAETFPGGAASLVISENWEALGTIAQSIPALENNKKAGVRWQLRPNSSGMLPIKIDVNGRVFSSSIKIEPAINVSSANYVPEPRPVDTGPYEMGVYYFPGWSPDQWSRWEKQKGFPERDPALGFYREGDPEVADWHIKWAVENGISFFMYDWYWRDGHIDLEKGLEDGYLKAKYRDYLKFCVMWANHAGFADHSLDQLLTVTDYWLENYFSRECYYKIDGKPVISFFAPNNLTRDLDGSQNVRAAFDAMRKRVQEAGLPGIYFIACGDNSPDGQRHFRSEGYDTVSAYNYPHAGATSQRSPYSALMDGHIPIWNRALDEQIIPYIPLLTVGWDSRPWHGEDARIRFGRTTEIFEEGLMGMKEWMDANGVKVGLLECWNEWGEGSYIEPNTEFGFGDLEAIRSVFARPGDWPQNIAPSDVGLGPYHIDELDHGLPD